MAGGAALIAACPLSELFSQELKTHGTQVSRTTGRPRKVIPTTCLNCYARCGLLAYVESGKLVKLGGNPEHPNSRGRACAKGQAGLNVENNPSRVLYPLKRAGERGQCSWTKVPWDVAMREIADKMIALKSAGRASEFVIQSTRDISTKDFTKRFCYAFGSPHALVHCGFSGTNKSAALRMTLGIPYDIPDVANARYILCFGANPYEAHILRTSFLQRLVEGRSTSVKKGQVHYAAKLVTFDVRNSLTAGRSDEWFPVNPGTDALVALAMANVIMEEGLHDAEIIEKWTNCTVEELRAHLKQFTPDAAEKISGVSAKDIARIAIEFASAKPATTISTGGVSKHKNGVQTERCIILLNVITGNIDVRGGLMMPRQIVLPPVPPEPPLPAERNAFVDSKGFPLISHEVPDLVFKKIESGEAKVGVYMTYRHNPVYSSPEVSTSIAVLKSERLIPFYVAIDDFITESNVYADYVLPSATYLERYELDAPPAIEIQPIISLRQPVVHPAGAARSYPDILIDLAKRIGNGTEKYFAFQSHEDYLDAMLSEIPDLVRVGGFAHLKKHGLWVDGSKPAEYRTYLKVGFATPSGKIQIKVSDLEKVKMSAMPAYDDGYSSPGESGKHTVVIHQVNVHTHDSTAQCKWLQEIQHYPHAFINPKLADGIEVGDGDFVVIASSVGSVILKCVVSQGVHPSVIAIPDSSGHKGYGGYATGEPFHSDEPDSRLIWWKIARFGMNPRVLVPAQFDEAGGGTASMDTRATIRKAKPEEIPVVREGFSLRHLLASPWFQVGGTVVGCTFLGWVIGEKKDERTEQAGQNNNQVQGS